VPIVQHLIADTFGSHIGKYSERLKITCKSQTLAQAPLLHLQTVSVLNRGVSISADALQACCERGIPIFFVDSSGEPYASLYAPGLAATVLTRREQLRAYDDERGRHLALAFAAGKITNQASSLKYLAKTRQESPLAEELAHAATAVLGHLAWLEGLEGLSLEDLRGQVLAAEGNAAQVYWQAAGLILPEAYQWPGRQGRGATDPLNSLLNYGYGILYGQIERALVLAGLDPYAGFIHADRPGKPSLVYDVIEEFRQACVDRVVFGLAARHFSVEQDAKGLLGEATRRNYAEHILQHLEATTRYHGQRHALRHVIQLQARHLAAFLRGEYDAYTPFKAEG
jgi:CRISPR-associated protein Cas1